MSKNVKPFYESEIKALFFLFGSGAIMGLTLWAINLPWWVIIPLLISMWLLWNAWVHMQESLLTRTQTLIEHYFKIAEQKFEPEEPKNPLPAQCMLPLIPEVEGQEQGDAIPNGFKVLVERAFFRLQPGWDSLVGFDEDIARRNAESATETYLEELSAAITKLNLGPVGIFLSCWILMHDKNAQEITAEKPEALADFINSTFNNEEAPLIT